MTCPAKWFPSSSTNRYAEHTRAHLDAAAATNGPKSRFFAKTRPKMQKVDKKSTVYFSLNFHLTVL